MNKLKAALAAASVLLNGARNGGLLKDLKRRLCRSLGCCDSKEPRLIVGFKGYVPRRNIVDPIQLYIPKDQKAEIILTPQAADGGTTTIDGQASAETSDIGRASYHLIDDQVDGLHFFVEPGLEADAMDAEPAVLTLKADVRHGPGIVEKSVVFHVKTVNTQAEGFGVNIVGFVPR